MTPSALSIVLYALICVWVLGGIALRFGGRLIALAGLIGMILNGNASGVLVFASAVAFGLRATCTSACATALQERARRTGLPCHLDCLAAGSKPPL